MTDSKIREMLATNAAQKKYYEKTSAREVSRINSFGTNLWRATRGRALGTFEGTDRRRSVRALHRKWIGDVTASRVLDLGVGSGNLLSVELAAAAAEYVAIDLSAPRLAVFAEMLKENNIHSARLVAGDFLGDDFTDGPFDLIRAQAVIHHFRHLDRLLDRLEEKLAPGGRIVTYDPAQTWFPARMVRALYRPFQTDSAWEYPFDEKAMQLIENRFEVLDCQGVLGASKWALAAGIVSRRLGAKMAQKLHTHDMVHKVTTKDLRSCLNVSYHLRKRKDVAGNHSRSINARS